MPQKSESFPLYGKERNQEDPVFETPDAVEIPKGIPRKGTYRQQREPVHPGRILADYMEAKGWNQTEFAELIDVSRPHLNEIINGKRGISAKMAVKLSIAFDTTEKFWKNLDTKRELWEARRQDPREFDGIRKRIKEHTEKDAA